MLTLKKKDDSGNGCTKRAHLKVHILACSGFSALKTLLIHKSLVNVVDMVHIQLGTIFALQKKKVWQVKKGKEEPVQNHVLENNNGETVLKICVHV